LGQGIATENSYNREIPHAGKDYGSNREDIFFRFDPVRLSPDITLDIV
jgi:hypothetical protein